MVFLLAQFLKKAIYFTSSSFLSSGRILMLDMLTSCFSFLIHIARSIIDLAVSSDELSDGRSFVPTCKMKWSGHLFTDGFTKLFMYVVFVPEKILRSIKVFCHTIYYDKYRYFVLCSFWFVIFVIIRCDCFLWVTTTTQWSYGSHVLVGLLRYILVLLLLLTFFFFIVEAHCNVSLAFLAFDGFCVL